LARDPADPTGAETVDSEVGQVDLEALGEDQEALRVSLGVQGCEDVDLEDRQWDRTALDRQ